LKESVIYHIAYQNYDLHQRSKIWLKGHYW